MSQDAGRQALQALSRFLVADSSLGDALLAVANIATDVMPSARMAGIAMLDSDGHAQTSVFTDEESPEVDKGQYSSGRGPCLDAWRTRVVVRIDEMEDATDDYPEFAQLAASHGIRSTLSLPMVAGDEGIGALNLYADNPAGFSKDDEEVGVDLAAAAAALLSNASAYWEARNLSEQLSEAMKSRAEIEQAKGMLMAQTPGITADDAFDLLRRASQRENVKLREIARRIVERRSPSHNSSSPPVSGGTRRPDPAPGR